MSLSKFIIIFREGHFKGIQITAEKNNNKNVTKIVGLETFVVPLAEADKQLNALVYQFE